VPAGNSQRAPSPKSVDLLTIIGAFLLDKACRPYEQKASAGLVIASL
jgi:hypothetical protein